MTTLKSEDEQILRLKDEIAKRDAILLELGIQFEDLEDVYSKVLVNAKRYEWLRDRMSLENIPEEQPDWSVPDEYESLRIDKIIDGLMQL